MKKGELTITYELLQQIKHKFNTNNLFEIAIHLTNFWIGEHYKYTDEYEFFMHYKAIRFWIEISQELPKIETERYKSKKSMKEELEQIDKEINEIKYNIIQLWKKGLLKSKLKKCKLELTKSTNGYDRYDLELRIKMLKDLIEKYPNFKTQLMLNFMENLNYVGKI
jgi:hypothetical protein